jgi:hypothetical protein
MGASGTPLLGLTIVICAIALFFCFWPRTGLPRIRERSALLRDMVPLAAVSGLATGITMISSVFGR